MSSEPTACHPTFDDNDDETPSDWPDFYVDLTPETLRDMYLATGGGESEPSPTTRYVYAVDGLRFADDGLTPRPCEYTISRFQEVICSGAADNLDEQVHEIFERLIFYSEDAKNSTLIDLWNWWPVRCPTPLMNIVEFEIEAEDGRCWKNVHPDHMSVFDMT